MKHINRWVIFMLVCVGLLLSACGPKSETVTYISPSKLEPIEGSELQRVILTEKAAERIGAERTYFTHICHDLPHAATCARLPAGVELAYDGLVLEM